MILNQALSDHYQTILARLGRKKPGENTIKKTISPNKKTTYEFFVSGPTMEAAGIEYLSSTQ